MKFYVAGPATEIEICRQLIQKIESHGHEVTFNWTHLQEDGGEGIVRPHWRDHQGEAYVHARKEWFGVKECHTLVFWLPTNPTDGKGCYWEAGIASADPYKNIWLLNYEYHGSDLVFYYLPNVKKLSMHEFDGALSVAAMV